jgi:hypothetical protein
MRDSFESILDESISALQAGVPIEDILAEVPDYAPQLRPLLYAAAVLADPDPAMVAEDKKARLRAEYMKQVVQLPAAPPPPFGQKFRAIVAIVKRRTSRKAVLSDLAAVAITLVLTLVMAALVLNYLARDTIPNDFLYSVKRISESVQLAFTFNQGRQVELEERFNERRLAELDQLIQQKRAATIEFKGTLETKGTNLWVVEGHLVLLPGEAAIVGDPQEGDRVKVSGMLRTNNALVAERIELVE